MCADRIIIIIFFLFFHILQTNIDRAISLIAYIIHFFFFSSEITQLGRSVGYDNMQLHYIYANALYINYCLYKPLNIKQISKKMK